MSLGICNDYAIAMIPCFYVNMAPLKRIFFILIGCQTVGLISYEALNPTYAMMLTDIIVRG